MGRNNPFKKSKIYQILVAGIVLLYFGYQIYTGEFGETVQDTNSVYSQENQYSEVINTGMGYDFRSEELLASHYEKHGIEMGFSSREEYLQAANMVLENRDTLHKTEAEDGDDVYFLEATNEFVVVSKDGYIRTYFCPEDGIEYFNRQ